MPIYLTIFFTHTHINYANEKNFTHTHPIEYDTN
jgi:hypothetical protein